MDLESKVNDMSTIDSDFEINRITRFLKTSIESSKAKGFVIGISGGIDSAVVATLCHKSLGSERVLGILLFEDFHRESVDYKDAKLLADNLGIKIIDISISPLVSAYEQILSVAYPDSSKITRANLKARIRMTILYAIANQENYLVAGTGDKSEELLGYFTKYGDGGVDVLPIAHLYKGQVRLLGRELGLPESVVTKPSSPNLWQGQKASDELPADYETLDPLLSLLFDHSLGPYEVSKKTGAPLSLIDEVIRLNLASRHKRSVAPTVTNF
jgi:NAD+ synthase